MALEALDRTEAPAPTAASADDPAAAAPLVELPAIVRPDGTADTAAPTTTLAATVPSDLSREGRIAAYRQAVLDAAAAAEAQALAEATLEARLADAEAGSAEILALMDMVGTAGAAQGRGDEFAALREAYDAALQAEAAETVEREALRKAAGRAGVESAAARRAAASAREAVVEGRNLSPDVLAELHRLLGIDDEVRALELEADGTFLASETGGTD